jgi:NTE family protein
MTALRIPNRLASYDKRVALVLQGGGALGSYQAGVYEALSESEYLPDWVAGISIGAINAAIIAGNAPEKRVERLHEFWDGITASPFSGPQTPFPVWSAILFGQPGFFTPRPAIEWMIGPKPTSLYTIDSLRPTLEKLVDFDRINARETRLSVGAVNVRTGNFAYFDNAEITIRPEHIMASAALPPGFPPVEIDGELYWDGGLVSNTPLEYVIGFYPRRSRLIFQVDLFCAKGPTPTNLDEVCERDKDIRYSSRTRAGTDMMLMAHNLRYNINGLWDMLPEELRSTPEARFLYEYSCVTTMDVATLIYRPAKRQGNAKDIRFSRSTMLERWEQGRQDAQTTLEASPWLAPMAEDEGARTFDVPLDRARQIVAAS